MLYPVLLAALVGLIAYLRYFPLAQGFRYNRSPTDFRIGSRALYRQGHELYAYDEAWNVHGHRSARQDWWTKVQLTGRGTFVYVGKQYKDNVGYKPIEGRPWCYPYLPMTTGELKAHDAHLGARVGTVDRSVGLSS